MNIRLVALPAAFAVVSWIGMLGRKKAQKGKKSLLSFCAFLRLSPWNQSGCGAAALCLLAA